MHALALFVGKLSRLWRIEGYPPHFAPSHYRTLFPRSPVLKYCSRILSISFP